MDCRAPQEENNAHGNFYSDECRQMLTTSLFSSFLAYIRSILEHVPSEHIVVIVIVSFVMITLNLILKKGSRFGVFASGITFFWGLLLLDVAVFGLFTDSFRYKSKMDIAAEINRLIYGSEMLRVQYLSSFFAFIPFGLFLSEFLASVKRFIVPGVGSDLRRWPALASPSALSASSCSCTWAFSN